MRIVKQDFYDKFLCTADKCIDTCCQGWQIIDDEGNVLPFVDNKCPKMNEKGLCTQVLEKGEESLCYICHMYPRHVEEYDGVREWSLSLSCPEALRMTICEEKPASYVVEENDEEEPMADDFDDFDYMLYSKLEDSRECMYGILKNQNLDIYKRMAIMLKMSYELQLCADEGQYFDMDDIIKKYEDISYIEGIESLNPYDEFDEHSGILLELEKLWEDWNDVLNRIPDIKSEKKKSIATPMMLENILESMIYTYYLGAVYDYFIYAKTAFCVYTVIFTDRLASLASDMDDYLRIVYKYAREVEHSDENINKLLEYWDEFCK